MTTTCKLTDKINIIIAKTLDFPAKDIHPDQHLCYDLLADSLALLNIILNIEEDFSCELNNLQIANVNYVKDLHALVAKVLG